MGKIVLIWTSALCDRRLASSRCDAKPLHFATQTTTTRLKNRTALAQQMIDVRSADHLSSILSSSSAFKVILIYTDSIDSALMTPLANMYAGSLLVTFYAVCVDILDGPLEEPAVIVVQRGVGSVAQQSSSLNWPVLAAAEWFQFVSSRVPLGARIVHANTGDMQTIVKEVRDCLPL